nr:putative cytosol aminopeptidase [Chlamydiota bacterium]
ILRGLTEGILLSDYQFLEYTTKKKKESKITTISLVGVDAKDLKQIEHIRGIIRGVYLTKDLVNRNADEVHPQYLVDLAHTLDDQFTHIHTTTFDKKRLSEEGLELLLAVGRGSDYDPALIICKYEGDPKSKDHTVVVGKGVTYDTGGLDLKTSMLTMKCDMGGAGTCLGLLLAAATTKLKLNFTVVIPTTENTIGARSYKPGDVYKSYSGKTVEIGNTDAEGRLILADALAYVCKKLKPTRVIDFATLTGAIVISLGNEVTGMMSNHDQLADDLTAAGKETYERVWRLPLIEEYSSKLKSDIADLKNFSGREAGSIKAALFLREFITDVPWAHLDIAGSSFLSEGRDYLPKYATGLGVRLMMQYFENRMSV